MITPTAPPVVRPGASTLPSAPAGKPDEDAASISIGPTLLAAAAILAGASALGTPIAGSSWVLPLVEVVVVIWLVGVGGRLIRVPTVVTAGLQLVGFIIALTSLFTSSGIGGVIPDKQVIAEAGALLSGAWHQIIETAPPAPSTPELSFLIALAVGCAAFLADFLVAEAKAPALVALPLLCLYSVPASIASTMLPWYTFAVPAVLYVALLAATGHKDRRTGTRAGVGLALHGGAITALATVTALLVAGSVTSVGTAGRLPHTNAANGQIGLSPFTSLHGNLNDSQTINLLSVSGLQGPAYLRTVSLDDWTPNKGWSLGNLNPDISDLTSGLADSLSPAGSQVVVTSLNFKDRFLPIFNKTGGVTGLDGSWQFDTALNTVFRSDGVKPGPYTLTADLTKPRPADLRKDTVVAGGQLSETGSLAASVRDKAAEVTGDATNPFDKALALERWFTNPANGFVYSLKVPTGNSGDALVDFLDLKQGYCEQYASAMAIMLRSLNIPTRVVVGFTQGTRTADGSYLITSHDAHAWVEVKFDNAGWVSFDPTPPVGGQGGEQGFTPDSAQPTTGPTTSGAAGTQLSTSAKLPSDETSRSVTATKTVATQVGLASGAGPTVGNVLSWIVLALVVIAVIVGLLLLPTALRRRRRRQRLALTRSGSPGGAGAAWDEVEATAVDHGIYPRSAESARVTANRLARRAHLGDADRLRLRTVVVEAEREWYSPAAPSPVPIPPSGADRQPAESDGSRSTMTMSPRVTDLDAAEMAAGVESVVSGLRTNAPIRLTDRIIPRSMRRSSR